MRSSSGELVRASTREKWYEYDHRYPDLQSPIDTLTTVQTVSSEGPEAFPVLLCHVCSDCGRMRSAGFHRSHPVIPGEPVISSPCRRCRKYSGSSDEHCERQITHIRECKSDEPCDWPYMLDDVHVQVDRGRRRSRSRDRDDIYISRHRSTSRPQIIKKSESRTSLGLRALQDQIKSPRLFRRKSKVRIASMSPPREYDRVHVEVTRDRSPGFPPRKEYLQEDYHVIRRESSLPRVLPRLEMRSRSISPARYRYRDDYHEVDVERHEVSHYKASDLVDDFTPLSSPAFSDSYVVPTPRSILKSTSTDVATTHHRRMSTPNVARETRYVEVSSPRVEYIQTSKGKQHRERSESRERIKIKTTQRHSLDEPYLVREDREYLDRRGSERIRFVESEQPLVQEFEEMQIRDRVRSESPHVTTRGRSTTRYSTTRSQSPAESYERVVSYRGQSPGPHERVTAGYRTVQRPALPESESTTTIIDKQSFQDGRRRPSDPSDFVTVRKWRGLDENGKPATFVEETKRSPCPPRRDSSRFPRGYTDKVSVMATAGSIREI
ncbi:hypothetical protein BU24DRAFT_427867 [Aaosphaeria arxii CBS 175.79]|uniref:Uncharacterized protein n=1 Tax=Aaosphaeria arxii CBS 175.79 TaxID=1450172 RepID=A0A6A5XAA7_9PLEO|nr:uncharacterized protein BU24DRAFT_427867 [Aaosphaeria arxii CBS 175.79]KAF2009843.1 hypothetical protein BU24DRAFT_427867 [Aaosphaeria arxii CBS 175.79]